MDKKETRIKQEREGKVQVYCIKHDIFQKLGLEMIGC